MSGDRDPGQPLLFPGLIGIRGVLLCVTREEARSLWIKGHLEGNRFLLKRCATEERRLSLLVDRTGAYRPVHILRARRAWARFLAPVYDAVRCEAEIAPGERLSNGAFRERIGGLKGAPSFRRAALLKSFLKDEPADEPFDASRLRRFWDRHCPPLPEERWHEQYPD